MKLLKPIKPLKPSPSLPTFALSSIANDRYIYLTKSLPPDVYIRSDGRNL